jgi:very-short-patch-repair endonuclease
MPEPCPVSPAYRDPRDTVRVAEFARHQCGVVSRVQLAALGLSSSAISRWDAAGRLHRVLPGVYAVGHSAVPLQGRLTAALLYAGPRAVFSHTTAAWLWSLIDAEPTRIHVTVPARRGSLPTLCVHRSRSVEVARYRNLPLTTVPRTLLDLAAILPSAQIRRALAEADYRRLVDPTDVEAALGRGRAGSSALRRALEEHNPSLARTLSALEERFLELCRKSQIPLPEVNVKIAGLMVDAFWRQQRLVVELDGHAAHGSAAALERDRQRELKLRAAGYSVMRYTWQQVTEQSELVLADLRAALASPGSPPAPPRPASRRR